MTDERSVPAASIFLKENLPEPIALEVARREVILYCHGSPERSDDSEDAAACFPVSETTGVLLVADGVGGQQSGEVAAEITVRSVQQALVETPPSGSLRELLLDAIDAANAAIMERGRGAATTVALVELQADFFRPYHVGDSMITLLSQRGRVKWQSIGHAPVGYAIEAGVLDEVEGMVHPDRHIVSNVVGQGDMRISVGPRLEMALRDTLVLCSDGLSDNVSTEEIVELLRAGPLLAGCTELVELARSRMNSQPSGSFIGKPDDLTLIACRCLPEPA